jgi:hypothetical protein
MENGFNSLLVSEGQVTAGLKAMSVAQDEGGSRQNVGYRRLGPAV